MSIPTMFDTYVEFSGIKLHVDPINRKRHEENDNVMAIFQEEQPFTWDFCQPYITEALETSKGACEFLDVGCGSGVFAILMAKHFPETSVIAIDKNPRAVEQARKNALLNEVVIETRHEPYSVESFPEQSARVIGLYPPYHLYPEDIAWEIPQHARGGSDGQKEFKHQLTIAGKHLSPDGIIFFNQMCLGDAAGPGFLRYLPRIIPGSSLTYTEVFPRMRTVGFLRGVYGERHQKYVTETSNQSPWLYYTVGIIKNDGLEKLSAVSHERELFGRSWADRIALHQAIAAHEFK